MKKITIQIIFTLISFSLFSQIPTNGLIGYYPFTGNANDLSGNSNDGTITGASLTTDRFSNPNSAYSFNGTSSYLKINNSSTIANFSNSFSLSFWINNDPANTTARQQIFMTRQDANANDLGSWDFPLINDTIYCTTIGAIKIKPDKGAWVNVIFTYDASSHCLKAYKNGVLTTQGCNTSWTPSNSKPIQIGASMYNDGSTINPNAYWRYFNGKLDDFLFYNRILSSSEISSIYQDGFCKQSVSVSDTLRISTITGINSIPSDFGTVKIYPNPSRDALNITIANPSNNYTLKIFNSVSTEVFSTVLNSSSTQVNLSTLGSSGLYLIQILDVSNNILETKKLILE